MRFRKFKRLVSLLLTCAVMLGTVNVITIETSASNTASLCTSSCTAQRWHQHSGWWYYRTTAPLRGLWEVNEANNSPHVFHFFFREAGTQTDPPTNGPIGSMLTGWVWDGSYWRYFNPNVDSGNQGKMVTGWLRTGNQTYYLHTANNVPQGGTIGTMVNAPPPLATFPFFIDGRTRTFNAAGHCVTNAPTIRQARIRFDSTYYSNGGSPRRINNDFNTAVSGFGAASPTGFNVAFSLNSNIQQSSLLEAGSCFPNCGAHGHNVAHRRASLLTNTIITPQQSNVHTVRAMGVRLCNGRIDIGGSARCPGWESTVTTQWDENLAFLIQHELSHNLGAYYDECSAQTNPSLRCVLQEENDIGIWCIGCRVAINRNI